MRRVLGCVLGLALALTACDSDNEEAAPRPRATVLTTTSTTAPSDPYAVPETIDVAYVQRVIDKLYEIEAEAAAEIVREREIVPTAAEKLSSIYEIDELNSELAEWNEIVADDFADVAPSGGAVRVRVDALVVAQRPCINARTTVDPRARFPAGEEAVYYTVLVPRAPNTPDLNPTPWIIRTQASGGRAGEPLPYDPCAAS